MIFSEIPIKSHYVYDFNEITSFLDYECYDEPSTCLDEEIMFLPFLEDTLAVIADCVKILSLIRLIQAYLYQFIN